MKNTPNTASKIVIPRKSGNGRVSQELLDSLESISDDDIKMIGEEMEKAKEKRLQKESMIPQELKDFREKWEKEINLSEEKKKLIIEAVDKISPRVTIESDGSRLVEFKLGGKMYKCLDVNLKEHSDTKYLISYSYNWQKNNEVKLLGMIGDDTSKRGNKELAEYVDKQKNDRKMKIPTIEFQRELVNKLGNEAGLTKVSDKIAMWMYLTGNYGDYWLTMGNNQNSGRQGNSRSQLVCIDDSRKFNYSENVYNYASLCLIACN